MTTGQRDRKLAAAVRRLDEAYRLIVDALDGQYSLPHRDRLDDMELARAADAAREAKRRITIEQDSQRLRRRNIERQTAQEVRT